MGILLPLHPQKHVSNLTADSQFDEIRECHFAGSLSEKTQFELLKSVQKLLMTRLRNRYQREYPFWREDICSNKESSVQ